LLITVILNVLVTKQRPRILLQDPRYRRAKARVNELGQAMIAQRRGLPLPPPAQRTLIDDVMAAHVERPDLFPESDLVLTLTGPYVAGLDTVANTLAATVYAVLKDPHVLARVTADADALFDGGVIDEKTLTTGIPAINGAISEAMRLYPIAVAQMRTATRDFEFEGMQIEADEMLYVATSVPHFMEEFFPDPYRFDIDRYAKPRAEDRAAGAYSPFGRGPHLCLGKALAEVQMALTIASLFHRRSLRLPSPDYTLKTKTAPTPGPSRRFAVKVTSRRR
jgi:cytochrome P450